MIYKFENLSNNEGFVPYKITFEIKTQEDASKFHDNIARHLPERSCRFIADAYQRIRANRGYSEGEI